MSAQPVHVAIRPGQGIVARTGAGVLVVLPGGNEAVQDQLLATFTEACQSHATPGRTMARKLVGLLSQRDPEDVPSFGACAPNERGWAVILHQGVTVHIEHGGQVTSLSGFDAATWVDRIVDDGFTALTLLGDGEELGPVNTRFRFDGGLIPGAGATIVPAEAAAAPVPAPDMAADHSAGAMPAPTAMSMGDRSAAAAMGGHPHGDPMAPAPLPERPLPPITPTADPVQQSRADATSAAPTAMQPPPAPIAPQPPPAPVEPTPVVGTLAAGGGFFAQQPGHVMPGEEDEPPTLIQPSTHRDAQPMPADAERMAEELPAEDVPFESVPLLDIGPDVKREPLAVLTADTPKEEIVDASSPLVYGVLSPSGYFNHPDALFCAVTGVSMLHRTHVLVQRPRPPLGVVVADDGSTFTLDSSYVVGREPERDPKVEADEARPLKLQDAERSLSRVHAEIRLIDWDVNIVDRGSANGTYVLPRGGQQWKRLVADTPERIVPGTRVAFGKRVMTYESHHQINQAVAS